MRDANVGVSRVHHEELQRHVPCQQELFDDIQDRCSPCEPHMVEPVEPQWGRATLRPTDDLACQPKNAHATSAKATVMAAATNQMSVLRATRLRVGLNPMLFSIAAIATKQTHTR